VVDIQKPSLELRYSLRYLTRSVLYILFFLQFELPIQFLRNITVGTNYLTILKNVILF